VYRKARRAGYEWPQVSIIHPEHGSFRFSIHGVRASDGCVTLLAFHGRPEAEKPKMVDVVFSSARNLRAEVIELSEDDVSEDLGIFVAAQAHAHPDTGVLVLPGAEWGIADRPAA